MAVYPVAPGNTDFSSTSTNKYTAAIYSALLIKKFYPSTVFGEIANTDYQGEIKAQGDTVYIRTRPTIETFEYKKGMILPIQNPDSPFVELNINKGQGFSVALDRVDEAQMDVKALNIWGEDAAEQMKQVIDRAILGDIYSQAGAKNTGNTTAGAISGNLSFGAAGAAVDITGATDGTEGNMLLQKIIEAGQALDEQNIPESDRFIIIPAWAAKYLKLSDLKASYITGDGSTPLRNGKIGMIDRFKLFVSNNLTGVSGTGTWCIFGHPAALTFASQITETRTIENPFSFGKLLQGLQVYGYKVVKSDALGALYIK